MKNDTKKNKTTCTITIEPARIEVFAAHGDNLLMALRRAGIMIDSPCGGKGLCGKCTVEVTGGTVLTEKDGRESPASGTVLACRSRVVEDMALSIGEFDSPMKQDLLSRHSLTRFGIEPAVTKHFIKLPEPAFSDRRSDFERLRDTLRETYPDLSPRCRCLHKLPFVLRDKNFNVTAVLRGDEIINVEAGDTTDTLFGVALDLGTTTITAALVDLASGHLAGIATALNPQAAFGADVISRIEYSQGRRENLIELQATALAAIAKLIDDLSAAAGTVPDRIAEVTVACNTVMNHILLSLPADNIAVVPFVPVTVRPQDARAADLGIMTCPDARLHTLPGVSGFLGSDIVAGALVAGVKESEKPVLMVDLGTNSEIIVGNKKRIVGCSAAAGPAFEGGKISCGMRAVPGAIESVELADDDIVLHTVAGGEPAGICGTGLVALAAFLRTQGVIDETGFIADPGSLDPAVPAKIRKRIRTKGKASEFVLHKRKGKKISVTQRDIRELQLAKGALAAGIAIALGEFGAKLGDVEKVLIAGSFGSYLDKESALAIGLFPDMVDKEKIFFVGNSAIEGAAAALVNRGVRDRMQEIADYIECIELSSHPSFQEIFVDSMLF